MGYSGAYIDDPLDSGEMAEDFHSVIYTPKIQIS